MKTVIIFATKTGTTEKCANKLKDRLENAICVNIETEKPDISAFDTAIIGAPIRCGMIHKSIKKFVSENKETLKTKKAAYFVCCGFSVNYNQYFDTNFPKELLDTAVLKGCFGGELNPEKLKGFDKFITNMVMKADKDSNKPVPSLDEKAIDDFACSLNLIK